MRVLRVHSTAHPNCNKSSPILALYKVILQMHYNQFMQWHFACHLQFTLLQNLVIVCIILYFQCRFRTPTVTDLQAIHKNFVLLHQSIKYLILLYQWWCNSNINCLTPLIVPTTPFTTNHIHVEIISNYLYKGTDHKVCQNILICANLLWDFYIKGL